MSRKKKIILSAAACLMILVIGGLIWGGNYLVTFAIGRSTGMQDIVPEPTLSEETNQGIARNWEDQIRQAREWMENAEVSRAEVRSADGLRLCGEAVITDPASHLWVIAVHGYRGSHGYMSTLASYYGQRGWNALLPDLRGCGDSEGDYIGMGWPDRKDMLQWINWITALDGDARIVLHGISMGGATVMMTAGEDLPAQVRAVVEDCGYTSVWDIFADELDYLFHLPTFPMLNIGSAISSLRAGYSFTEASALNQIAKAQVPVLFIHGSEDNFVHTDMVYRLYDACPGEKELLVVDGAGHGNSFSHAPDTYFDTVFRFLENRMDG